MNNQRNIVIVDDDENLCVLLAYALELEGGKVRIAHSGEEMFKLLHQAPCDLLILDLGLPDEDGLVLTRQVRAQYRMPILILTGRRDRESLYTAMELGANDYVTKPFDPREVMLRAKGLLGLTISPVSQTTDHHQFNGWQLDEENRSFCSPQGVKINLTPGEFRLLLRLAKSVGKPVSRHELLDALAQGGEGPLPRMIDVYITQIRKKMAPHEKGYPTISSVRGYGYKIEIHT